MRGRKCYSRQQKNEQQHIHKRYFCHLHEILVIFIIMLMCPRWGSATPGSWWSPINNFCDREPGHDLGLLLVYGDPGQKCCPPGDRLVFVWFLFVCLTSKPPLPVNRLGAVYSIAIKTINSLKKTP